MNEVEKKGIGKLGVALIICVFLVGIFAISTIVLYIECDQLSTTIHSLERQRDSLNSQYYHYIADHHYSDEEYDEAQFDFYYIFPEEQLFGVYNLNDTFFGWEWYTPFEEGVFDCSEMSAYLEWYLENVGWHTKIVVGDSPYGYGYHAWLLVETSEGTYMPVESITAEIVWGDDPYFDNYFEYDRSFETIRGALAYHETEFDWWVSS